MAQPNPLQRASNFGIEREHVEILYAIAAWFNSIPFDIGGESIRIGTHYEPTLSDLVGSNPNFSWSQAHDKAHRWMIDTGLFKSENRDETAYLAGKKCRWIPTENGMAYMENILTDVTDIEPFWKRDRHTGSPLYRDGNELLAHRKGVLAAARLYFEMPFILSYLMYPRDKGSRAVADLWLNGTEETWQFEALTESNSRDHWVRKWRGLTENNRRTVWVFDKRETAVEFLNCIHHQSSNFDDPQRLNLHNGPMRGNKKNWPMDAINTKLRLTRENGGVSYQAAFLALTTGQIISADGGQLHDWMTDYNLYNIPNR